MNSLLQPFSKQNIWTLSGLWGSTAFLNELNIFGFWTVTWTRDTCQLLLHYVLPSLREDIVNYISSTRAELWCQSEWSRVKLLNFVYSFCDVLYGITSCGSSTVNKKDGFTQNCTVNLNTWVNRIHVKCLSSLLTSYKPQPAFYQPIQSNNTKNVLGHPEFISVYRHMHTIPG